MPAMVNVSVFLLDHIMLDVFEIELIPEMVATIIAIAQPARVVFKFIFKITKHQLILCK